MNEASELTPDGPSPPEASCFNMGQEGQEEPAPRDRQHFGTKPAFQNFCRGVSVSVIFGLILFHSAMASFADPVLDLSPHLPLIRQGLERRGFVVLDGCVTRAFAEACRAEAVSLREGTLVDDSVKDGDPTTAAAAAAAAGAAAGGAGLKMARGEISRGDAGQQSLAPVKRSDLIHWLKLGDRGGGGGGGGGSGRLRHLKAAARGLEALSPLLNDYFDGPSGAGRPDRMSFMVACYPGDSSVGYVKHRDSRPDLRTPPGRKVTALFYLNPDWRETDGGQLRLWWEGADGVTGAPEPDGVATTTLVAPLLGRLVFFVSTMEHVRLAGMTMIWGGAVGGAAGLLLYFVSFSLLFLFGLGVPGK